MLLWVARALVDEAKLPSLEVPAPLPACLPACLEMLQMCAVVRLR